MIKITFSKKQWDSLGSVKKTAQITPIDPNEVPAQPIVSTPTPTPTPVSRTFTCSYDLEARTQDLVLKVRRPDGSLVYLARTGPEAQAEEVDIIEDQKVMIDKNDLEGLRKFLVRINVMASMDKLVKGVKK